MTKQSELISNNNVDLAELSYVGLLKEGSKAGSSDHAPKILGISGGAVSAVTGPLAVIGEEFGEELLSGLGGGAFIGLGFMIYRFFKVAWEIEGQEFDESKTD